MGIFSEKKRQYEMLATVSSSWGHIDAWLADNAPTVWEEIRVVDDWLYTYRADDRVRPEQYQRQCLRLQALYERLPDGWSIDDTSIT
jgi:hypothetical protein